MPERMSLPDRSELVEGAFLTPRVVDAGTFDELSSRLREIIGEAADQVSTLHETRSEISTMAEDVQSSSERVGKALEALKGGLSRIDERIERAESVLEQATEQARAVERVEQRIEEIDQRVEEAVASRTKELDQRVESLLERLESQAASAEQRASEASERLERTGGELDERMATAERKRDEIVEGAEQRLDRLGDDLNQRTEQIKQELGSAAGPIVTNLNLLCQRATELLGRDPRLGSEEAESQPPREGSLGEVVGRAGELAEQLDRSVREGASIREGASQAEASLRETLRQGTEAAETLEQRVESVRTATDEAQQRQSELEAAIEARRSDLDLIADLPSEARLAGLRAQIESLTGSGSALEEVQASARETSTRLDRLGDKNRRLKKSIDEVDSRVESARERVGEQLEQITAMIDQPAAQLGTQIEEVNSWLSGLIDQANRAGRETEQAAERCAEQAHRAGEAIEALEPWREILLEAESGALPAGAQEAIDRVRTELGHQLDRAQAVIARLREQVGAAEGASGGSTAGARAEASGSDVSEDAASVREPKPAGGEGPAPRQRDSEAGDRRSRPAPPRIGGISIRSGYRRVDRPAEHASGDQRGEGASERSEADDAPGGSGEAGS